MSSWTGSCFSAWLAGLVGCRKGEGERGAAEHSGSGEGKLDHYVPCQCESGKSLRLVTLRLETLRLGGALEWL